MGTIFGMKQQKPLLGFVISFVMAVTTVSLQAPLASAQATACPVLPDTYGRITLPKDSEPINIAQQTEYTVWLRMRVKEAAHKVVVSVDGTSTAGCGVAMGVPSGATVNQWIWVKTKAAGGDNKVTVPAGNLKIQIAGDSSSPNVDIDRVLLVSDNCDPSQSIFGTNCTDSTPTPTTNPTGNPTPTTVPTGIAQYDVFPDGKIDINDLAILIRDYPRPGQPVVTNSPADFDKNGRVDVIDLSKMISNWGKQTN